MANGSLDHRLTFYAAAARSSRRSAATSAISDTWVYRQLHGGPGARRTGAITSPRLPRCMAAGSSAGAIYPRDLRLRPVALRELLPGPHLPAHDTTYTQFVGHAADPQHRLRPAAHHAAVRRISDLDAAAVWRPRREFLRVVVGRHQHRRADLNWRPTPQLRSQLHVQRADSIGGTATARSSDETLIPRLDVEYQLSRPIFFRFIGQYDAAYQDNLRDDSRTNLPIFIRDPTTGVYHARARRSRATCSSSRVCSPTSPSPAPWRSSATATT